MMCAKHVDDIRVGAERKQVQKLIECLEAVFAKLKYNEETFTTIGVRHVHHPTLSGDPERSVSAMRTSCLAGPSGSAS